jgi:2OG-Fe(II) oxygenase superfamily
MIGVRGMSPAAPKFSPGSAEELAQLRTQFDRRHCVRLPRFLDPGLREQVAAGVERADFFERSHGKIGSEECMYPNSTLAVLLFAANDERLFRVIREITGCGPIGCFDGRVYRLRPASGDYDSWHSDMADNRMIAMSVNLGTGPYAGGVLQIRDLRSDQIVHEQPPVDPGDAVVFRLAEYLRHQVTPVEGATARIAFAGWFKSRPTFHSVVRGAEWSA